MADFWDEFDDDKEEEIKAAGEGEETEPGDEELAAERDEDTTDSEDAYDNDEADSAVAAAEEDEVEDEEEEMAAPKTKAGRGKKSGERSKAEWIRDEITRRRDKGESLRPKDILQSLADKGVTVVAPQVSIALRDMGLRATREPELAGVGGEEEKSRIARRVKPPKPPVSTKAPGGKMAFSTDELQAAHDFVAQCGGLQRTNELLSAIAKLQLRH